MAEYEEDVDDLDAGIDEKDLIEEIVDNEKQEKTHEHRALQFLSIHHPECRLDYVEQNLKLLPLESFPPDKTNKHHKSVPYLTQFEKTKILGFRANQLAQGARALAEIPPHITDVLDIARYELDLKRLPFLIKRPMPDGTYEIVRLQDLLLL